MVTGLKESANHRSMGNRQRRSSPFWVLGQRLVQKDGTWDVTETWKEGGEKKEEGDGVI